MGSYIGSGVKYIKIARYDAFGNDNYTSLRELKKVRIRTNDAGIIEYPIATITEYSTYFLYQTATTNITSSTNNFIPSHSVSASKSSNIATGSVPGTLRQQDGFVQITNLTEVSDPGLNFNELGGWYQPNYTPNIPLTLKIRFNYTGSGAGSDARAGVFTMYDSFNTGSGILATFTTPNNSGSAQSASFSGSVSIYPIENGFYTMWMSISSSTLGAGLVFNNFEFEISQSTAPAAGIGAQAVLEPYITVPFVNSDYNAIINNASENRLSEDFMDVDYADSLNTPINLIALISGSATPAQIQDSNYTTQRVISSRYTGKQLQSAKLNVWSSTDIAPSKTPNVSNPKSYFVRFNWLGGTTPEWGNNNVGRTNVSVKSIVDENGVEIIPVLDERGVNLGILEQAFGGSNATLLLNNPDSFGVNLDSVNNTVPVFRVGQRIKPILYTQTASYDSSGNVIGFGFTGSINFTQPDGQTLSTGSNNYSAYVLGATNLTIAAASTAGNISFSILADTSGTYVIPFGSTRSHLQSIGNSASFFSGSSPVQYWYQPTGSLGSLSSSGYILYFSFNMKTRSTFNGSKVTYILQKSTNGGSNWSNLFTSPQVIYTGTYRGNGRETSQYTSTANSQFAYTERNATTSSLYRLAVIAPDIPSGQFLILDEPTFAVRQYPAATFNQTSTSCTLFWNTGSSSNTLLASTGSVSAGGLNQFIGFKQKDINNSGFDPITLAFDPQPSDEIRFQGLENLSFSVISITQSATGQLQLNLDNDIPNGTNLNYFLLRRYVVDPGNIILDITKPAGQTSDGVLVPEYIADTAKKVVESILPGLNT